MATNEEKLSAASVLRYLVQAVPGTKMWDAYTAMLELENYMLSVGIDCTLEELVYPVLTEANGEVNETNVDREALFALADEIDCPVEFDMQTSAEAIGMRLARQKISRRIREVLGVTGDGC